MNISHIPSKIYTLSLIIAILMAAASLAGLFLPAAIYPSVELRRAFLSNDVVNLFLGLPILLVSMAAARRGSLMGLLFWPGALFYLTYNYLAYSIAMPFSLPFVLFLALVILSIYNISCLLSGIDAAAVQEKLQGKVAERFTGGAVIGLSVLFILLAVGEIAGYLNGSSERSWANVSVRIADLLISPFWLAGGILLWRKRAPGYVVGAGLLFQLSMLFVGLLIFFILQPMVAGVPFPVEDFVVVAVMSLIGFVPFGLFVRGIISKR